MQESTRSRIQVLNFIMTCVIVMFHSDMSEQTTLNTMINSVATLAMCFFFWTTGCLLFYKLDYHSYGAKIKRRVLSLLVPYFIWQFLFFIKDILVGAKISITGFLEAVFFLNGQLPDGALWYLYVIFILALLSPIQLMIYKNKYLLYLLIIACVPISSIIVQRGGNKCNNKKSHKLSTGLYLGHSIWLFV